MDTLHYTMRLRTEMLDSSACSYPKAQMFMRVTDPEQLLFIRRHVMDRVIQRCESFYNRYYAIKSAFMIETSGDSLLYILRSIHRKKTLFASFCHMGQMYTHKIQMETRLYIWLVTLIPRVSSFN